MSPSAHSDEPDGPQGSDGPSDDELFDAAASADDDPSVSGSGTSGAGVPGDLSPRDAPGDAIDEELQSLINSAEADSAVLAAVVAERDQYLEALQRVKAEFDNYKRRTDRERIEVGEQANARLAEALLPVLDACQAAISHGSADVEPIYSSLVGELTKSGLSVMDPVGEAFDPTLHDAVMHEPGEGDDDGPVVVELLRQGYQWKGRVVRPAMVKVRG